MKKLENGSVWKLIWDAETKDVLLLKNIECELETMNELFETRNKNDIYKKINELGLIYNPEYLEEEEWV